MHEKETISNENARLSVKDNVRLRVNNSQKLSKNMESQETINLNVMPVASSTTLAAHSQSKVSSNKVKNNLKSPTSLNEATQKPLRLRIVLLGAERTGKSCLIKRYCEKRFVSKYMPTIGIDYGATKICVDKCDVSVHIFDTSGSDLFTDVRNEFYYDAHGILVVFDVTKRDTFDNLHEWIYEINAELHRRGSYQNNQDSNLPIILICGNKIDLVNSKGNDKNTHDSVEEIEARLWADVHGFQYYETSANTGEGVSDMFSTFFSTIVRQQLTHGGKLPKTPASARRVQMGGQGNSCISSPMLSPKALKLLKHEMSSEANERLKPSMEQENVIKRLQQGKDAWEQLGVVRGCSKEELNKMYRKLAILLHPDKTGVKGADDAFKLLCIARKNILLSL